MNLKGLTIEQIKQLTWEELNSLSRKELAQVTSRLVSASNKRIKRLEKTKRGTSSFAYQTVEQRGRKFSVRGKNVNQLKSEFKNARNFLNMKTSTVKGWNKYRKEMETRTGQITSGESYEWSDRTWKKYWKVYRRFEESHGGTFKKGDSDRIQQMLTEVMNSNDKRRSADSFQQLIEDEYEEMYESDDYDDEDVEDIFDTDW